VADHWLVFRRLNIKTLTPIPLIIHPPNLNDTHLNSYSVSSGNWTSLFPLEIGPEHGQRPGAEFGRDGKSLH